MVGNRKPRVGGLFASSGVDGVRVFFMQCLAMSIPYVVFSSRWLSGLRLLPAFPHDAAQVYLLHRTSRFDALFDRRLPHGCTTYRGAEAGTPPCVRIKHRNLGTSLTKNRGQKVQRPYARTNTSTHTLGFRFLRLPDTHVEAFKAATHPLLVNAFQAQYHTRTKRHHPAPTFRSSSTSDRGPRNP